MLQESKHSNKDRAGTRGAYKIYIKDISCETRRQKN
jgi:hypothetical protein